MSALDTDRRRYLRVLREMATDYKHRATGFENSVERRHLAGRMHERHGACRWALRQLEPMTEGPRQILDAMAGE